MIFNMTGGGKKPENPLNFEIVGGTSQPSNPKENTIWVNTSTDITSWVFSTKQPENPDNGMVWITAGNDGSVKFNALKKNDITIYPQTAKQYISGKFEDKPALSYLNGKWVEWYNGELYYNGNEYDFITGGWSPNNVEASTNGFSALNITRNTDNIVLRETTAYKSGCFSTTNAVDVSKYKTAYFEIALTNDASNDIWALFSVHLLRDDPRGGVEAFVESGTNSQVVALDISALSGEHYITLGLYSQCTLTLRKVWLV